jgi:threonylcarbamoyladenosine tRNA methylthiotransferase MtaB
MKKVFIHTFGCKVNQYDTQVLRERLAGQGYTFAAGLEEADLVIVNSCTVTAEADRQCRQLVRKIARRNAQARIIVTGCYAAKKDSGLQGLVPPLEVIPDRDSVLADCTAAARSVITDFYDHSRAFVKIQDGCDAFCSYCIVPMVRSRMWSKPLEEAVSEVRALVAKGYPEIVLTGVHLGRYAYGIAKIVAQLAKLDGRFRVRLSSLEMNEVTPDIIGLIRSDEERFCAHFHLPLQSASDTVLKRMNRQYRASDFAGTLEMIYRELPAAAITTDVITGFPGESEQDFSETRDFLERYRFSKVHVFSYSAREGTPASLFQGRVPEKEIKERTRVLNQLDKELQKKYWSHFIGMTRTVVREGNANTLLTDNYIRLCFDPEKTTFPRGLSKAKIYELSGKPWGSNPG